MALLALASLAVRDAAAVARAAAAVGRVRRLAVLRRRGADAGDLGAVGGRGPGGRHRGVQALRRAARGRQCWSRCSRCSATAPRSSGALFGPVACSGSSRSAPPASARHRRRARRCSRRSNPLHALRLLTEHGCASFVVLGAVLLAFTGAEALYADMGHFGKRADPHRLVRPRAAGAGAELLRTGRAADGEPDGDRESVLPAASGLGALSDGRPRDRRHGHRLAGDDLGHLLAHASRRSSSATCRA